MSENNENATEEQNIEDFEKIMKDFYKDSIVINNELICDFDIDIKSLLNKNEIDKFPDIYNKTGRKRLKKKWGLFILEK